MKNNLKEYKGFSLIEILWAVAILSILIVTVTGIFTGLLLSSKKNNKLVTATGLAEKQLEYIKLLSSTDIPINSVYDGSVQVGDNIHDDVYFPPYPPQPAFLREFVEGIMYYYKIETSYVPDTGDKVINIKVTVYWDVNQNEGENYVTLVLYKKT